MKQFKEGGKEIFSSNNNIELSNKSLEISKLHEKIGEVIMERDFFKKSLGGVAMETRKNFINIAHPHFSINKQCQILEVGKSSYYYQQKPPNNFIRFT